MFKIPCYRQALLTVSPCVDTRGCTYLGNFENPYLNGKTDGLRVLVGRLWPRGLSKERAAISVWLKDLAPRTELRQWFAHDPGKWPQFQARYRKERREKRESLKLLRQKSNERDVTLLYGPQIEEHNEAIVLKKVLEEHK